MQFLVTWNNKPKEKWNIFTDFFCWYFCCCFSYLYYLLEDTAKELSTEKWKYKAFSFRKKTEFPLNNDLSIFCFIQNVTRSSLRTKKNHVNYYWVSEEWEKKSHKEITILIVQIKFKNKWKPNIKLFVFQWRLLFLWLISIKTMSFINRT